MEEQEGGKVLEKDQLQAIKSVPQLRGAVEELSDMHKQFLEIDQEVWILNMGRREGVDLDIITLISSLSSHLISYPCSFYFPLSFSLLGS